VYGRHLYLIINSFICRNDKPYYFFSINTKPAEHFFINIWNIQNEPTHVEWNIYSDFYDAPYIGNAYIGIAGNNRPAESIVTDNIKIDVAPDPSRMILPGSGPPGLLGLRQEEHGCEHPNYEFEYRTVFPL
jgi:hypothetical protein